MNQGWSYGRDLPPNRWYEVFPEAAGRMQSPVTLCHDAAFTDPISADVIPDYVEDEVLLDVNNPLLEGFFYEDLHFEAKLKHGANAGGVRIGGQLHKLKKFHLHTPSEHLINDQSFPMEIHLVHHSPVAGKAGTAVGIMVKEGLQDSPLLALFRLLLPHAKLPGLPKGLDSSTSATPISLNGYPPEGSYFRYEGSLTTPPCTEGIKFYIFDHPLEASRETINQFAKFFPGGNNRPLQSLNERQVFYRRPTKDASARTNQTHGD